MGRIFGLAAVEINILISVMDQGSQHIAGSTHISELSSAADDNDQVIGYKFVHLGKMMEMVGNGLEANEAMEKATSQYGRFDDAVKYIDPRKE